MKKIIRMLLITIISVTIGGSEAEVSSFAGFFFEYNLPDDILTHNSYRDCTNFSFMILAVSKEVWMYLP